MFTLHSVNFDYLSLTITYWKPGSFSAYFVFYNWLHITGSKNSKSCKKHPRNDHKDTYNKKTLLTLSWPRSLLYRNQSIDLQRKSMDWFLYDMGHRHERVKHFQASLRPVLGNFRLAIAIKDDILDNGSYKIGNQDFS